MGALYETMKFFDGRRTDGIETAERPVDEIMDLMQHHLKKELNINPSEISWIELSYNLQLVQMCRTFGEMTYSKRGSPDTVNEEQKGNANSDKVDKQNRKKSRAVVKLGLEKRLVDELLSLSKVFEETPG